MITNAVCRVFRSSSEGLVCVGEYPCMKQEVKAAEVKKYGEDGLTVQRFIFPTFRLML